METHHFLFYGIVVRYDDNGDMITPDDMITIGEGFLSFSSTAKSDEGTITCVAENSVGNSTTSTNLRVLGMSTAAVVYCCTLPM